MTKPTLRNQIWSPEQIDQLWDDAVLKSEPSGHAAAHAAMGLVKNPLMIVMAGQSLSAGQGVVDSTAESPQGNVYEYDHTGVLRTATEPVSGPAYAQWDVTPYCETLGASASTLPNPGHSEHLKAGKLIAGATGIPVLLVPGGVGSTTFSDWVPKANPLDRTTPFGNLNYRIKQLSTIGAPDLILLSHGESDAASSTFLADFHTEINNFRAAWGANLPVIFDQLCNSGVSTTYGTMYCKAGEYLRQCEADYGLSGTINKFGAPTYYNSASSGVTIGGNTGGSAIVAGALASDGNITTDVTYTTNGLPYLMIPLAQNTTYRFTAKFNSNTGTPGAYLMLYENGSNISGAYAPNSATTSFDFTSGSEASPKLQIYIAGNGSAGSANIEFSLATVSGTENIKISSAIMVVTHDCPRVDVTHRNTDANKEVGRRIALAYRERVLMDTSVDGTGPRLSAVVNVDSTHTKIVWDRTIQDDGANQWKDNAGLYLFRIYDNDNTTERAVSSCAIATTNKTNDSILVTHAAKANAGKVSYGDRQGPAINTWRLGVVRGLSPDAQGRAMGLPAPMFYGVAAT